MKRRNSHRYPRRLQIAHIRNSIRRAPPVLFIPIEEAGANVLFRVTATEGKSITVSRYRGSPISDRLLDE